MLEGFIDSEILYLGAFKLKVQLLDVGVSFSGAKFMSFFGKWHPRGSDSACLGNVDSC